jgi:hypothetical protein
MARAALLAALLLLGVVAPRAHFTAEARGRGINQAAGAPAPSPPAAAASASTPIMNTGAAFVAVCVPCRAACARALAKGARASIAHRCIAGGACPPTLPFSLTLWRRLARAAAQQHGAD